MSSDKKKSPFLGLDESVEDDGGLFNGFSAQADESLTLDEPDLEFASPNHGLLGGTKKAVGTDPSSSVMDSVTPAVPPVTEREDFSGAVLLRPDEDSAVESVVADIEDSGFLETLTDEDLLTVPPPPRGKLPPKQPPASPGSLRRSTMPPPPPGASSRQPTLKVSRGLIGAILVQNRLITEQQRDVVLDLQRQSGNYFKFGDLAVKNGFVSASNLKRALAAQQKFVANVKEEKSRMMRLPEEVAKLQVAESEETVESKATRCMKWLVSGARHGASDMHIMAGQPLILRHSGKLVKSKQKALSATEAKSVLMEVLTKDEQLSLAANKSLTKTISLGKYGRVRANIFQHMEGVNGVFRLVPLVPPTLVSLNMPSTIARFTTYAQGLVLLTGPIGCGKTTTMAALLDIVNKDRPDHIITVDRTIEFVHKNHMSLVSQRQIGKHTQSFSAALRAALREDPDVIAVGEMNDIETARLAISAAETGHLVLATLHTDNAVRTINRVLDIFPPDEQNQIRTMLAESLRGVVCQRLVRRADEPGLIPVTETLFTTAAMRNLIKDNKIFQMPNAMKMNRDAGNKTFKDAAGELKEAGIISDKTYAQFCSEEG